MSLLCHIIRTVWRDNLVRIYLVEAEQISISSASSHEICALFCTTVLPLSLFYNGTTAVLLEAVYQYMIAYGSYMICATWYVYELYAFRTEYPREEIVTFRRR